MSFLPSIYITIGKYEFNHVYFGRINQSRKTLVDTAIIQLPQNYNGRYIAEKITTGMEVEIKLGYNGKLYTEFTGYVSEIEPRTPVMIRCEDEMYKLKRSKPESKSWATTTLKEVLTYLVPDATLEVPELTLKPFNVEKNISVAKALQKIKENFGLDVYFRNGILYAGLAYSDPAITDSNPVIYNLSGEKQNVITPMLTYRKSDDVSIRVRAVSIMSNNTVYEKEVGDPEGELRTLHFYSVPKNQLEAMANEKLISLKYDGCKGSLLTFGLPRSEHGQIAKLQNDKYGARDGSYFIDAVTITFGVTGYRREVYIGKKAA